MTRLAYVLVYLLRLLLGISVRIAALPIVLIGAGLVWIARKVEPQ